MLSLQILRVRLMQREQSLLAEAEPCYRLPGPRLHTLLGFSFTPGKDDRLGKKEKRQPTKRLTASMTSRNTSFFRYLMPSERQDTALVTVAGGLGAPVSSLWPS